MVGKTNMDEFAMGSSTENSAFFTTRNPWDLDRVPGGSSGGSAAAVAADEAIFALGSDTGGSIRQPASFCGVVGMKPTYGRVSRYGLVAFASSLDQIGPLTKDVSDCALVLNVIAGHDPRDSTSLELAGARLHRRPWCTDVKGLRVGVPKEYFAEGIEPGGGDAGAGGRRAAEGAGRRGARRSRCPTPSYGLACLLHHRPGRGQLQPGPLRRRAVRLLARRTPDNMCDMYCKTRERGLRAEVKRRIMLGTYALSAGYYDAYYLKAQKVRTLIKRDFDEAFEQFDVLVAPDLARPWPSRSARRRTTRWPCTCPTSAPSR